MSGSWTKSNERVWEMKRVSLHIVLLLFTLLLGICPLRAEISAIWNAEYNPTMHDKKYSPLIGIEISDDQDGMNACNELFTFRKQRVIPSGLIFTSGHTRDEIAYSGQDIPVVVATSNRSSFLLKQLSVDIPENRRNLWSPDTHTANIALWIDPRRTGRDLYLVVPDKEYAAYARLSALPNVFVVACKGTAGDANHANHEFGGFGFSRHCAISLMRHLSFRKIWLVDDNVSHVLGIDSDRPGNFLTRLFKKSGTRPDVLGYFEAFQANRGQVALAFDPREAFVRYEDNRHDRKELMRRIKDYEPKTDISDDDADFPNGDNTATHVAAIILWDLDELNSNDTPINYSPVFVTSKEDLGLSSYLSVLSDSRLSSNTEWHEMKPRPRRPFIVLPDMRMLKLVSKPDTQTNQQSRIYTTLSSQGDFMIADIADGYRKKPVAKFIPEELAVHEERSATISKAIECLLERCLRKGSDYIPEDVFEGTLETNINWVVTP